MKKYTIEKIKQKKGDIFVTSDYVFSYHTHMHNYYEMTLYQPFEGSVTVNNEKIKIDSITAILIIPSDFHKIEVESVKDSKFIKISFDSTILNSVSDPNSSIVLQSLNDDKSVSVLFKEILHNIKDRKYIQILINAIVYRLTNDANQIIPLSSNDSRLAIKALQIVNEHFCENISLVSVSEQILIAPQYLSLIFKNNFDIGFSQYLCSKRLGYAAKLLTETTQSITEICFECGYRNLSHFLRSFKKEYGISPKKYRSGDNNP